MKSAGRTPKAHAMNVVDADKMNVYTKEGYRRKGIARKLVRMLIEEAEVKGVTEISLDTTDLGKALYESLGFRMSDECMVMKAMEKSQLEQ